MKKDNILSWQSRQFYDLSNIEQNEIDNSRSILINESNLLHSFSRKGYPIYYYEDIYLKKDKSKIDDMFKYLDIDLNEAIYNNYVVSDAFRIRLSENEVMFKSII
jgi:hypothetical protein